MQWRILAITFLAGFTIIAQAQKGEKSVTAGLLLSFPTEDVLYTNGTLKTGFGVEATGQSNISNHGALLLQTSLVGHGYDSYPRNTYNNRLVLFSLKGGYRYQFGASGIYLNVLAGVDIPLTDFSVRLPIALGAGKRFLIKDGYFVDVGVDYVGDVNRVNLKAAFSILHRPRLGKS